MDDHIATLESKVEAAELQLKRLREELEQARQHKDHFDDLRAKSPAWPLQTAEYRRYARQMILPQVGIAGQLALRSAKVLVVGVGGLGCPALAYLSGAGIGTLGLVDGDTVEVSNLHRQILHATARVGMSKVDSAYEYLKGLNPRVHYERYNYRLTPEQAIPLFEQYDLVLDCTDHPTSRYLISDACVLTGKPLVSASALKTEGQLIVLNHPARPPGYSLGGPCYRCIFPKPPPADSIVSCGEGGILGLVVGVMGVLQALEAIKVLIERSTAQPTASTNGDSPDSPAKTSMLMFSAYSSTQFRTIRMRSRRPNCAVCSDQATIKRQSLTSGSLDYIAFCGLTSPINILPTGKRISAGEFAKVSDEARTVIDTRDETQFGICALPRSVNVPWTGNAEAWLDRAQQAGLLDTDTSSIYVVCRLGNDSQLAAKAILDRSDNALQVKDVRGGFKAWREEVDPEWPDI